MNYILNTQGVFCLDPLILCIHFHYDLDHVPGWFKGVSKFLMCPIAQCLPGEGSMLGDLLGCMGDSPKAPLSSLCAFITYCLHRCLSNVVLKYGMQSFGLYKRKMSLILCKSLSLKFCQVYLK